MSIVKETTHALQSVFPTAELGTFLDFSRKEKEKHLAELTRIVSGIRLFNKNTGQGNSRGIEGEKIYKLICTRNYQIAIYLHRVGEKW